MKRSLPLIGLSLSLTLLATLAVLVLARLLQSNDNGVAPEDGNAAWQTRMRLRSVHHTLADYKRIANDDDRQLLREIRTVGELWGLVQKKADLARGEILFPADEGGFSDLLNDGWGKPYVLEKTIKNNITTIRIMSDLSRDFYVEAVFDPQGPRTKCSWDRSQ